MIYGHYISFGVVASRARWTSGKGSKALRAALATGRHILIAVYAILRDSETVFTDVGRDYFDRWAPRARVQREIRRIQSLGYRVTVEPLTPAGS